MFLKFQPMIVSSDALTRSHVAGLLRTVSISFLAYIGPIKLGEFQYILQPKMIIVPSIDAKSATDMQRKRTVSRTATIWSLPFAKQPADAGTSRNQLALQRLDVPRPATGRTAHK